MNDAVRAFFEHHYSPGRIGLIGATDVVGALIRDAQAAITPERRPSHWSHSFILGEKRGDGRTDGSIYIFESDLKVSVKDWQVQNGVMESRVVKWCREDVDHACVLGIELPAEEADRIVSAALNYAYDERRLRYPVGELFGTLLAFLLRRFNKRNVFDDRYAVQCATFVRMCYQAVGRDPITGPLDLTHTSPEALFQSPLFTFRKEWP